MIRAATLALLGVTASAVQGLPGGGIGAACATNDDCKQGLFCDGEKCADKNDFTGGGKGDPVGSPCDWDGDCGDGLQCRNKVCTYVGEDQEEGLDRRLTRELDEGDEVHMYYTNTTGGEEHMDDDKGGEDHDHDDDEGEQTCSTAGECHHSDCVNAETEDSVEVCGQHDHCVCRHPCGLWLEPWHLKECERFTVYTSTCGKALLPGVWETCDECAPILPKFTFLDFGGSCGSYCESQGLRCEAAKLVDWEEYEPCSTDHVSNESCDMEVFADTEFLEALCVCADYGDGPRRSALPPGRLGPVARECKDIFESWEGCSHDHADKHNIPFEHWHPGDEWKNYFHDMVDQAMDHHQRMSEGCADVDMGLAEELNLVTCAR